MNLQATIVYSANLVIAIMLVTPIVRRVYRQRGRALAVLTFVAIVLITFAFCVLATIAIMAPVSMILSPILY